MEEKNGLKVAEMTYTKNGNYRIIIDHTEVSESQKGKGLGKKLIYHVANYAREMNIKEGVNQTLSMYYRNQNQLT